MSHHEVLIAGPAVIARSGLQPQLPGDEHPLHLAGAFADLQDLGVQVEPAEIARLSARNILGGLAREAAEDAALDELIIKAIDTVQRAPGRLPLPGGFGEADPSRPGLGADNLSWPLSFWLMQDEGRSS